MFAINLLSQPFLDHHLGFHIFFHLGFHIFFHLGFLHFFSQLCCFGVDCFTTIKAIMVHQDHHDYITVLHQISAMNICHFVPCCICCASDKILLRCPHLIGEKTNLHTISFRYLKCGLCMVLTKCYSYAIQPVHIKKLLWISLVLVVPFLAK